MSDKTIDEVVRLDNSVLLKTLCKSCPSRGGIIQGMCQKYTECNNEILIYQKNIKERLEKWHEAEVKKEKEKMLGDMEKWIKNNLGKDRNGFSVIYLDLKQKLAELR